MSSWEDLRHQEGRTLATRRAARDGSAFWNHEAQKEERELARLEMGDDIDD